MVFLVNTTDFYIIQEPCPLSNHSSPSMAYLHLVFLMQVWRTIAFVCFGFKVSHKFSNVLTPNWVPYLFEQFNLGREKKWLSMITQLMSFTMTVGLCPRVMMKLINWFSFPDLIIFLFKSLLHRTLIWTTLVIDQAFQIMVCARVI